MDRMTLGDIPAVHAIESSSFSTPWPTYAFRQEIETNRLARYIVAREDDRIVGYAGIWLMVDEAHITTFAVAPDRRRRGIGEALLLALLRMSGQVGASVATLEVRVSNMPARKLYEKYGFRPAGIRPRYYTDNNEDALIMTTGELASREMRMRLSHLENDLEARLTAPDDDETDPRDGRDGDGDGDGRRGTRWRRG